MRVFPDTSFLCALYRKQENSDRAVAWMAHAKTPLQVSWLVLWEFRHSVRFQAWLHKHDRTKGYPAAEARVMLAKLQANLKDRGLVVVEIDWADVHLLVEGLSGKYAETHGNRAMDTLHLATALHLGAREFLSFDSRQRTIATAEGLAVSPR